MHRPPVPEADGPLDYEGPGAVAPLLGGGGYKPSRPRRPSEHEHVLEMNGPFTEAERLARQRERETEDKLWRAQGHGLVSNEQDLSELSLGGQVGVRRDRQGLEVDPAIHQSSTSKASAKEEEQQRQAAKKEAQDEKGSSSSSSYSYKPPADEGYRIPEYRPTVSDYQVAEYKSIYD